MFHVVVRHWELIFILSTSTKFDLGGVEKVMFQDLPCHFEVYFCLFTIAKCELVEIEKNDVSKANMALSNYFRALDQPKMRP